MTTIDLREGRTASRRCDHYRRALDIVVGSILLLVALPVIVLVATSCAVALRAWPFFAQDRVGRDGRTFRFHKLRTLPVSAPAYVDKHQLDLAAVPPVCRLARRLHLDELPQLFLVLRGHMSLVGPRPEMRHLHDQLHPSFAATRTSVRPGCTGLWQVSDAASGLIGAAPEFDSWYVAHRTLRLDLWVMGRTALKMVGLGRAVTFDDLPAWTLPSSEQRDERVGRRTERATEALTAPAGSGR